MSDWLCPLSSKSGYRFEDGKYPDTSPGSFERMIVDGVRESWWVIRTNFRRVAVGDRVWCYYGWNDRDLGVVGLGIIDDIEHREDAGEHDVLLRWDRRVTKKLLKSPVPATAVRKYIPRPRASVVLLQPHPQLRRRLASAAGI